MSHLHQIAIIGAGPAGVALALACGRRGLDVALIDRGGLLQAMQDYPTNMTFFSTAEKIAIGGIPFPCPQAKPDKWQALAYYQAIALAGDARRYLHTRIEAVDDIDGGFACQHAGGSIQARRVVIATGFFQQPVRLGVPGEDRPQVSHYFTDGFAYAGMRLVIVGGANSAAIAALECWRLGAQVTLVHRGPTIDPRVKYWLRPDLENRLQEGAISARFATRLSRIDAASVRLQGHLGEEDLACEAVLLLTGYRSDYAFLDRCGIGREPHSKAPRLNPETLESQTRPGLHLLGCITAGDATSSIFIENARHDAERLAAHLQQVLA